MHQLTGLIMTVTPNKPRRIVNILVCIPHTILLELNSKVTRLVGNVIIALYSYISSIEIN